MGWLNVRGEPIVCMSEDALPPHIQQLGGKMVAAFVLVPLLGDLTRVRNARHFSNSFAQSAGAGS